MGDSMYKREVYPVERKEFLVPDRVERIHTLMPERVERVHVVERENLGPESGRYRSRSPVQYAATRQYQYQSRLGVPPVREAGPGSVTKTVTTYKTKVDQHHEFFVSELQADINELRNRQRDFGALQEQFGYLQEQYKQV